MPAYATISDLYAYRGEVEPENIPSAERMRLDALLDRATTRVTNRIRLARFRVGPDRRTPADANIVTALRDATAATVADWEENGTGNETYDSFAAAGVTLSRRAGTAAAAPNPRRLCDDAEAILGAANIFGTRVSG